MTAILKSIEDPRDSLDKARRVELVPFAKTHGLNVDENTPAILIRHMLRQKGVHRIAIPERVLGGQAPGNDRANDIDAVADLARQYQNSSDINSLRAECKRLGIKLSRRDTMDSMRAKINGENPS